MVVAAPGNVSHVAGSAMNIAADLNFSYSDFNRATASSPTISRSGLSGVGVGVRLGGVVLLGVLFVLGVFLGVGLGVFLAGVVFLLLGVVLLGVGLGVFFVLGVFLRAGVGLKRGGVALKRGGVGLPFGGVGFPFGGVGFLTTGLVAPPFIKKSNQ